MCSNRIYQNLIEDLRGLIVAKYGSISAFCVKEGVSRQNLTECFQGRQDISVGLFSRISAALNVVGGPPSAVECAVSLRDYITTGFSRRL